MSDVGRPWSAQIFDCFQEPQYACIYALDYSGVCPGIGFFASCCLTFEQFKMLKSKKHNPFIQTLIGILFCCFGHAYNRYIIRKHYNIEGHYLFDVLVHFGCHCCALIQQYREIKIYRHQNPNQLIILPNSYPVNYPGGNPYQMTGMSSQPQQYPSQPPIGDRKPIVPQTASQPLDQRTIQLRIQQQQAYARNYPHLYYPDQSKNGSQNQQQYPQMQPYQMQQGYQYQQESYYNQYQ